MNACLQAAQKPVENGSDGQTSEEDEHDGVVHTSSYSELQSRQPPVHRDTSSFQGFKSIFSHTPVAPNLSRKHKSNAGRLIQYLNHLPFHLQLHDDKNNKVMCITLHSNSAVYTQYFQSTFSLKPHILPVHQNSGIYSCSSAIYLQEWEYVRKRK